MQFGNSEGGSGTSWITYTELINKAFVPTPLSVCVCVPGPNSKSISLPGKSISNSYKSGKS